MCRYARSGPYKSHLVCFSCRKGFKQPPIRDWLAVRGRGFAYDELSKLWSHQPSLQRRESELGITLSELEDEYRNALYSCPECRQAMTDMGLDFKAPRQADENAWRILQGMYCIGHSFHTCGCDGPGYIPKAKADYRRYLEERLSSFEEQLRQMESSKDLSHVGRYEAGTYWRTRISKIKAELVAIA